MKNTAFFFLPALATAVFCACANPAETRYALLRKDVMAVHDAVMLNMDTLYKLEKRVRARLDALENPMQGPDSTYAAQLKSAGLNLGLSQEQMMEWMRRYDDPDPEKGIDSAAAYFDVQKAEMLRIGQLTDQSIAEANRLLALVPD